MSLFNFLPHTLTSQAAAGAGGFDVMSLVTMGGMIVVLGLVFYFFLYRPQKKQEKEATQMRDSVEIGDVISTVGGIVGVVVRVKGDMLLIETGADRTRLQVQKWAIRNVEEKAHPAPEPEKSAKSGKLKFKK